LAASNSVVFPQANLVVEPPRSEFIRPLAGNLAGQSSGRRIFRSLRADDGQGGEAAEIRKKATGEFSSTRNVRESGHEFRLATGP